MEKGLKIIQTFLCSCTFLFLGEFIIKLVIGNFRANRLHEVTTFNDCKNLLPESKRGVSKDFENIIKSIKLHIHSRVTVIDWTNL